MNKLFYHGMVVTMNEKEEIIFDGAVYIKGKQIEAVGQAAELLAKYPDVEKVDIQGRALLPGLINLHTHTVLSVLKGLADDVNTIKAVYGWMAIVNDLVTEEDSFHISRNGLLELIKAGSTTVVENSANMSAVAEAVKDSGLRGYLSAGKIHDYDLTPIRYGNYIHKPEIGERTLEAALALVEKWHGKEEGRIQCLIYPHATDTCSVELLREMKRLSDHYRTGVTLHMAQNTREVERIKTKYGRKPIEFMYDVGLLNEKLTNAHCIFLSQEELHLMAEYGATFINCAVINNKRGFKAPAHAALQAGVNVGFGTDNMFGDIIETMRYALSSMRIDSGDFALPTPYEILKMATVNGAKALGMSERLGTLEVGKLADLIMIDYRKPHLLPVNKNNIVENLVYNGMGSDVMMTIVDGRVIYEKGVSSLLPEQEVVRQAQKTAAAVWRQLVPMV